MSAYGVPRRFLSDRPTAFPEPARAFSGILVASMRRCSSNRLPTGRAKATIRNVSISPRVELEHEKGRPAHACTEGKTYTSSPSSGPTARWLAFTRQSPAPWHRRHRRDTLRRHCAGPRSCPSSRPSEEAADNTRQQPRADALRSLLRDRQINLFQLIRRTLAQRLQVEVADCGLFGLLKT
jgi:hypothetical protein